MRSTAVAAQKRARARGTCLHYQPRVSAPSFCPQDADTALPLAPSPPPARDADKDTNVARPCHRYGRRGVSRGRASSACRALATEGEGRQDGRLSHTAPSPPTARGPGRRAFVARRALAVHSEGRRESATTACGALAADGEGHQGRPTSKVGAPTAPTHGARDVRSTFRSAARAMLLGGSLRKPRV